MGYNGPFSGLYWAALGCIGLYWAVRAVHCTGLYLANQGGQDDHPDHPEECSVLSEHII